MAVGVGIPVRGWPDNRSWSYAEMADFAVRADRLGFDSAWAIDHYPMDGFNADLESLSGPDPLVLLTFVAARTQRIRLGTMVACAVFRSPGQLVRESKALAELSGGRFILALGSGSRPAELVANNLPVDHLTSRFEEYLEVVIRLLRGEAVDYQGKYVQLRGSQVLGGAVPELWVAASGPRSMRLAGRHAAGWAGARDEYPEQLALLRAEEAAAGRKPGSVVASRRAQALLLDDAEHARVMAENPEMSERVVVGTDELVALADEYRAAGCQHLILHFAGARWSNYAVDQLDAAASVLPRLRGRG